MLPMNRSTPHPRSLPQGVEALQVRIEFDGQPPTDVGSHHAVAVCFEAQAGTFRDDRAGFQGFGPGRFWVFGDTYVNFGPSDATPRDPGPTTRDILLQANVAAPARIIIPCKLAGYGIFSHVGSKAG
jgi:hypothetical protein